MQKNKTGFTLAEVLVTLAVIGVVAALTIPNLIQNSANAGIVTGVRKAQAVLSQAHASFIADDTTMDTVFAGNFQDANVLNRFIIKLNVVKNCGSAIGSGCFPDVMYKGLNNTDFLNINQNGRAKAILGDGMLIALSDYNSVCANDNGDNFLNNTCGYLYIDINGFKGPNQMGKDLFQFWVTRNGISPTGTNNDGHNCTLASTGYGCASKVLIDGAVNY